VRPLNTAAPAAGRYSEGGGYLCACAGRRYLCSGTCWGYLSDLDARGEGGGGGEGLCQCVHYCVGVPCQLAYVYGYEGGSGYGGGGEVDGGVH